MFLTESAPRTIGKFSLYVAMSMEYCDLYIVPLPAKKLMYSCFHPLAAACWVFSWSEEPLGTTYLILGLDTGALYQCSAVQCSAVQCSAVQCSAVQCSAVYITAVDKGAVQCSKLSDPTNYKSQSSQDHFVCYHSGTQGPRVRHSLPLRADMLNVEKS